FARRLSLKSFNADHHDAVLLRFPCCCSRRHRVGRLCASQRYNRCLLPYWHWLHEAHRHCCALQAHLAASLHRSGRHAHQRGRLSTRTRRCWRRCPDAL
ncbi:hypothetical protein JI435_039550, partial [Parastagonospora nodorum SN15]